MNQKSATSRIGVILPTYCEADKQTRLLRALVDFYKTVEPIIRQGVPIEKIRELGIVSELMRLKERKGLEPIEAASLEMKEQVAGVAEEYEVTV